MTIEAYETNERNMYLETQKSVFDEFLNIF